jgi:hypothetical protein
MPLRIKRHTLANALRVAAVQYMTDAHSASCIPGHAGLSKQFSDQSREANDLADELEQADDFTLVD